MPLVGFEPTAPSFERTKTFLVLDRATTVIDRKRNYYLSHRKGRAVAEAITHRLPTLAAPVRGRVKSCGICGGQSGTGAGFFRVFRIPLANHAFR
jgi:hypothetical protein